MKNKRFLSLVMAIILAASLFAGISVTASADGEVVTYTVKSGDYLYKICKNQGLDYYACKSAIMILNGFTTETQMNRVYVGQQIKLPASNALAATVSTTTTVSIGSSSSGTGTTVSTTTTSAGNDTVAFYLVPHTVTSGETLYSICNALGTSYAQYSSKILEMNGIKSVTHVYAGKSIYIPVATKPTSGTYLTVVNHKVASGDTMTSICNNLGIGYSANYKLIDGLNDTVNLNYIKVGQTVLVPTSKTISPVNPTPAPTSSPVSGAYKISFNSGANGSPYALVNGKTAASADAGTNVTVQGNPDSGFVVKSITVTKKSGGSVAVSNATFTMPAEDVTVKVLFEAGEFTVKTVSSGKGSAFALVNGAAISCANNGDTISLNLIPDYGYQVSTTAGDVSYQKLAGGNKINISKNSKGIYSFQMPNHNVKINVKFVAAPQLALTTNKTGNGSVSFEYDGKAITSAYANSTFIVKLAPGTGAAVDHDNFDVTTSKGTVEYTKLSDTTYSVTVTSTEAATVTVKAPFTTGYALTSNANVGGCGARFKVGATYDEASFASVAKEGQNVYIIPQLSGKYSFAASSAKDNILVTTGNGKSKVSSVAYDSTNKCYWFIMPAADVNAKLTVKEAASASYKIIHGYSASDALDFTTWTEGGVEQNSFAAGEWLQIKPIVPVGYEVKDVTRGYIGVSNAEVKKTDHNGVNGYWVQMPAADLWLGAAGRETSSDDAFVDVPAPRAQAENGAYDAPERGEVVAKIDGKNISGNARIGSTLTLDITPATNYSIQKVWVTSNSAGTKEIKQDSNGNYSYKVVAADKQGSEKIEFFVWFNDDTPVFAISNSDPAEEKGSYKFSVTHNGSTKEYGAREGAVAYAGDEVKITVSAKSGYMVNAVEVDGNMVILSSNTYTFTMPNHNVTTKVTFKEKP